MTAAKREEELCNEIQDVIDKYNDLTPTRSIGCNPTVRMSQEINGVNMRKNQFFQIHMGFDFDEHGAPKKYATVEAKITEEGKFIITMDKNIERKYWDEFGFSVTKEELEKKP